MSLAVQLPADERSAADARALLRDAFSERLPAVRLHDLLTIVTELVENGVRHGTGGDIDLDVDLLEGRLRGEVKSNGPGEIALGPVDHAAGTGLGLYIVDALADRWLADGNGVTLVVFELAVE